MSHTGDKRHQHDDPRGLDAVRAHEANRDAADPTDEIEKQRSIRSGLNKRLDAPDGDFPQHSRQGQAQSPVEDTHNEQPRQKEGHR